VLTDQWYSINIYPSIDGISLYWQDITDRKRAEEALKASEGKYRDLFLNMTEEVHFWKLVRDENGQIKTWRIVDANPPALKSWGRKSLEDTIGRTADEIYPGATEHFMPVVQKFMREGIAHSYVGYFPPPVDKYFHFTSVPMGECFMTTGTDITVIKKAEEAMRTSEERLRRIAQAGRIGFFEWNATRDQSYWSPEHYEIYGIEPGSTVTFERWLASVHPDDRELATRNAATLLERARAGDEGYAQHYEYRILRAGQMRWLESEATLHIQDGQAIVRGVLRDVTERKQAEEQLIRERAQLQSVFEAVGDGICVFDMAGNLVLANEAYARILGFPDAAAMRKDLSYFAPYFEIRELDGRIKPVEDWAASRVLRGERFTNRELAVRRTDTGQNWILSDSAAPVYDSQGRQILGVITAHDITERKREEEKLATAHRQIQSIIDNTPDIVYAFDLENRFIMANKAVAEVLNSTPEQLIGKRRHEFMSGEDADWHEANERRVIEAGKALEFEEYSQLDGRAITWLTKKFPLRHAQGKIYAVAGISADITERKQAEEALREVKASLEQKIRERTMHLQNLTEQLEKSRHELRKLASKLVRAEERERKRIAGVLHDDIAQILASARIRLDMLHNVPSDQDKQTLTDAKALLLQSIRETRNLMSDIGNPLLFDMGLKLACEALAKQMMERHPIRISCDIRDAFKHLNSDLKAILFQIVRELLNNVVKHSQARNAHVKIDMENGNFHVDVSDDGVGFDPQTLGGPTIEGGFGLYSVRERLIAMDGSLRIESAPGAGTVVTAILPAALE